MKQQVIAIFALLVMSIAGVSATVGASHAFAQKASPSAPSASVDQSENASDKPDTADDKTQDSNFNSSVKVSDTKEVDESTETNQLKAVAKISEAQAKAAAEQKVGGTAASIKLENENGNVVYAVTVGNKEVKVDAGNGAVLQVEATDSNDTSGQNDKGD